MNFESGPVDDQNLFCQGRSRHEQADGQGRDQSNAMFLEHVFLLRMLFYAEAGPTRPVRRSIAFV